MHWLDELREDTAPQLRDRRDYVRAAHELVRQGLKPRDIAVHLGLTANAVIELLQESAP